MPSVLVSPLGKVNKTVNTSVPPYDVICYKPNHMITPRITKCLQKYYSNTRQWHLSLGPKKSSTI
jgi:hypothetical protein